MFLCVHIVVTPRVYAYVHVPCCVFRVPMDSWIDGCIDQNCVIESFARIASGSVLAPGTLVEEATLYEGNPAKFVRKLSYDEKVRDACTLARAVLPTKHAQSGRESCTCWIQFMSPPFCLSPPTPPRSLTSFSLVLTTSLYISTVVHFVMWYVRPIGPHAYTFCRSLLRPDCPCETCSIVDRDRAHVSGAVHAVESGLHRRGKGEGGARHRHINVDENFRCTTLFLLS